jgi:hypothetical protein
MKAMASDVASKRLHVIWGERTGGRAQEVRKAAQPYGLKFENVTLRSTVEGGTGGRSVLADNR